MNKLSREECIFSLKKKGYSDGEIDIWLAGYDYRDLNDGEQSYKSQPSIGHVDTWTEDPTGKRFG